MINPMAFWTDENNLYSPGDMAEGDAKLNAWLQTPGNTTDISAPQRLLYGAMTAAPRAVEGLATSAATVGHWMGAMPESGDHFLPSLPAGTTGGQSAADLASGLMPLLIELPMMGAAPRMLAGATGLAKAAPIATRALVQGSEFAGLAASSGDAATTAEQFGEGSAAGLITSKLARSDPRRMLLAAALGMGSKMFFDRDGGQKIAGDWTQGDISGTAMGLTTALLGKPVPKWSRPAVGEIPVKAPEAPTVDYSTRNMIDARTGVVNLGGRSAADSAAAMQAAWGFDPNATNVVQPPPTISAQLSARAMQEAGVGRLGESRPNPLMPQGNPMLDQLIAPQSGLSAEASAEAILAAQAQRRAAAQHFAGVMAPPDVPLLPYAGNDNPFVQITDMHAPQTEPQILNRTPWRKDVIEAPGPINPNPGASPDYLTQQLFNPGNQQAIRDAAFGGFDPNLLNRGQITLQALQTDWFAHDVLQANRQQSHAFVEWMNGLTERPTVPEVLNNSPIARLAKSPNIPVEDLATELRAYTDAERIELGRAVQADPTDTLGLARALKEHYDPSLRPRIPPQTRMSEADVQAMLTGEKPVIDVNAEPPLTYRSEGEGTSGMQPGRTRTDPSWLGDQGGYADPALLYAGARGIIGAGAGYAIAGQQNLSEGDKWLAAAALGGAALFGPSVIRTLGRAGEAEAKIPEWGGRQPQRTTLSIEPPPRSTHNPRLAEMDNIRTERAAEVDNAQTLQRLQEGGMRKGKVRELPSWMSDEGGYTSTEMSLALGRASAGGLIGGTVGAMVDDPGSHTGLVTGTVSGILTAMVGPAIIRRVLSEAANARAPQINSTPSVAKALSTTAQVRKFTLPELLSRAQLAVNHKTALGVEPTILDKSLARLDKWFGLSLGPGFSRVLNQAAGPASRLTYIVDDAFRKLSFVQADDAMRDLTTKFLNGEMPKSDYLQQMSIDSNRKAYADFAIVARDSVDGLIDIASRGQGNAARSQLMKDSMGKYLTRSYRMFVDPSYSPSVEATNKLAQRIHESGAWADVDAGVNPSLDQITDGLNQYVREIQQSKGVYRPDSGKKIDQTVFGHRKVLDAEWKQYLGEITDPVDRIRLTVLKLKPMAEASNFMHQVTSGLNMSDEGLRYAFSSSGEHEAAKASVLQQLQKNPTDPVLRKQLLELQQYQYVAKDARYGALQGQYVHRNVYEVLNDWADANKVDSAAGRALMGINQLMKSNVTYRNPMGIVRQFISAPFFIGAARSWSGVADAWEIVRNADHPMHRELMENGISNVDAITKDVLRDVDRINGGMLNVSGLDGATAFLGRVDQNIAKAGAALKLADSKMADIFKMPDNFVRVSTYLAAKTRFANELGAALDSPEVINKAVEFTNRYTMNYSLLPKAVVTGRNVPFVNMFISYAAEMGRILKNLGEDVVKGDGPARMNAIMALGTMMALPEAVQRASEASLSDKDKKEWDKVKAGMPNYSKDRSYFVSRDQATGKFRVYDFSNLMPADQFQQTIRALAEGRPLDAAKNNPVVGWDNNPALNIAATYITGKDRFTGRKLRGGADYATTAWKEVMGPFAPGTGSQIEKFHQAYDTNVNGTRGITDKRGRTLTPEDFWLPYATAIKAGYIDPKAIEQSAIAEYKTNVANEMSYFNDIRRSNRSADVVERAAARTKDALQQLQDKLNLQLGINPKAQAVP